MLQINPFFRISVDDALGHPCFEKIRREAKEQCAENAVVIEFEDCEKLDTATLRQWFVRISNEIKSDKTLRK
jgi:hypothetical protein